MPPPRRCLWFASVSVPSPAPPQHLATPAPPGCPPRSRSRIPGPESPGRGRGPASPHLGQDACGEARSAQARPHPVARAGAFPVDATEALPIYGRILSSDATAVSGQIPGIPSPALPGKGRGARKEAGIFPGGRLPGPGKPQAWVQGVRGGWAALPSPGSRPRASRLRLAPGPRRAHAV